MNQENLNIVRFKVVIAIMGVAMVVLVTVGSFHLYDYTEHDPRFCVTCHVMDDPFVTWETSVHKDVECHDCHYATVLEKNTMLLKTVLERPAKISRSPHEKILVSSSMCIRCHWNKHEEVPQISASTGHAFHWFKKGMECTSCHGVELHKFEHQQGHCITCHEKNKVALAKMKDLACTDCHQFKGGKLMPDDDTCFTCHSDYKTPVPDAGPQGHSRFGCNGCHRNHEPDRPAAGECMDCHSLAVKRGKHPLHLKALGPDCLTCHQPHRWRVTQEESKELCSQCHKSYPLKTFG